MGAVIMEDREKQLQQIDKLLARFKTPCLGNEIRESLNHIIEISKDPDNFIPEAVAAANHDLVLLEMIEDGIELLVKAANAKF